jgi:SAM-dependent methyltransferase
MDDKKKVRDFYDQVGWHKVEGDEDVFEDAQQFEDLRPVCRDYIHRCHMRVNRFFKKPGKYFLDVASGPIQYAEYLTYSKEYEKRICVDISMLALREARIKLGDKGVYILADITNLPFKDSSIDAAVSLHTIYHVPADEQSKAFHEIHRVLKHGKTAAVVYSWGEHSLLMSLLFFPSRKIQKLRSIAAGILNWRKATDIENHVGVPETELYFHPHDYSFFKRQTWKFAYELLVWRSVSVPFTKKYIHTRLLGKQLLSLFFWFEDTFPHLAGRIGQYPLFYIKK